MYIPCNLSLFNMNNRNEVGGIVGCQRVSLSTLWCFYAPLHGHFVSPHPSHTGGKNSEQSHTGAQEKFCRDTVRWWIMIIRIQGRLRSIDLDTSEAVTKDAYCNPGAGPEEVRGFQNPLWLKFHFYSWQSCSRQQSIYYFSEKIMLIIYVNRQPTWNTTSYFL